MTFKNKFFLALLFLLSIYACTKNDAKTLPYDAYGITDKQGQLKIVYASSYNANPSVFIKINSNVVSSLITGRTPYPGGGFNTTGSNYPLYLSVPQGNDTVSIVRPKVGTNVDSIVLYKTVVTIPDNGAYTLHITDTLVSSTVNNTVSVLVKNDISPIDSGYARYRFVNLIPNMPSTGGAVDLWLNGVKMDSNVAYKQAGKAFTIRIGANSPGVTNPASIPVPRWIVRPAGAVYDTTAIPRYESGSTITNQRAFTVFAMGYYGVTTGTTRIPYVAFTLDKNN